LYALCGGIPRSIFNDASQFEFSTNGKLDFLPNLLSRMAKTNWKTAFNSIGEIMNTDYDHNAISSMIFHLIPRPVPRELYGQPLTQRSIVKWASSWMATEATQRLHDEGLKESALFLLSGNADYRLAALHGHVFEGLCHSILTRPFQPVKCRLRMLSPLPDLCDKNGAQVGLVDYLKQHGFPSVQTIPMQQVATNTAQVSMPRTRSAMARLLGRKKAIPMMRDEVFVEFPNLNLRQFVDNDELASSNTTPHQLWVPNNRRYEGVDAIVPDQATFLQMTQRVDHPVSLLNIKNLISRRAFPDQNMQNCVLLLFIVPKATFPNFTRIQNLTNLDAGDTPESVSTWLHQAVAEINVEKEFGLTPGYTNP
jgi:hypothetical protein